MTTQPQNSFKVGDTVLSKGKSSLEKFPCKIIELKDNAAIVEYPNGNKSLIIGLALLEAIDTDKGGE